MTPNAASTHEDLSAATKLRRGDQSPVLRVVRQCGRWNGFAAEIERGPQESEHRGAILRARVLNTKSIWAAEELDGMRSFREFRARLFEDEVVADEDAHSSVAFDKELVVVRELDVEKAVEGGAKPTGWQKSRWRGG